MYKSFNDESSPLSGGQNKGLRRRTKLLILFFIIVVLAAVITAVVVLLEKDAKEKKEKCILNEVKDNPPAPHPEHILLRYVSLPPTSPSNATGACSLDINPRGTGCLDPAPLALQSGSFFPDGNHILSFVTFSGAPAPPSPSSIYSGPQIIIIKVDGTNFSNGDPWKCITCGVPANQIFDFNNDLSYPQAYLDGQRVLASNNIISCSPFLLFDDSCTPSSTFIYSIFWSGGSLRELRIHPNNSYIGFNSMFFIDSATIAQFGGMGILSFNPSLSRYEINNVTLFYNLNPEQQMFYPNPSNNSELLFNPLAPTVGEFRGWSKDGTEVLWIGQPCESGNFDIMATSLSTGKTTRLTRNQEYTDPVDMSPDNGWTIVMDTRGSNRVMFASGIRGIPPLSDFVTTSVVASIRNNGQRRFFEPYLIDKYGDRGAYQGQKLTEGTEWDDPNWNGMADPRWSPNGTLVVFYQTLVTSPACGGINPLPCPSSSEPGGRRTRVMIATLADRKPTLPYIIPQVPSIIPWATPFIPGNPLPSIIYPFNDGTYTIRGKVSGTALFSFSSPSSSSTVVSVKYTNYSDDGYFIIDGEEYTYNNRSAVIVSLFWKSNIELSGCERGRKYTSEEGYSVRLDIMNAVVESNGTLTTILNGVSYTSPLPGT